MKIRDLLILGVAALLGGVLAGSPSGAFEVFARGPAAAPIPVSAPAVSAASPADFPGTELVGVGFSPGGGADKLVLGVVNGAKRELRVAAYTFTSRPLADALLRAKRRGVDVAVLMDEPKQSASPFIIPYMRANGIPFRLSTRYGIMHNKFIVADGNVVQTGSYNYTRAASAANAENVVVLRGAACAAAYLREWNRLWTEAQSAPRRPAAGGAGAAGVAR